jgi:hypothetical protein
MRSRYLSATWRPWGDEHSNAAPDGGPHLKHVGGVCLEGREAGCQTSYMGNTETSLLVVSDSFVVLLIELTMSV